MIEVGDYVRNKTGFIGKIITREGGYGLRYQLDIDKEIQDNWINGWIHEDNIIKHSKNIIDLIEVGDVLKLKKDDEICYIGFNKNTITLSYEDIKEDIKNGEFELVSIVTHEQFSQIEYKV